MSDTIATTRVEPIMDPGPVPAAAVAPEPAPAPTAPAAAPKAPAPETVSIRKPGQASAAPVGADQLARLEDKTARIEEKLARSESATQRVMDRFEAASQRMGEVALQSDLAAVRKEVGYVARRIRNLPGLTALAFTAIVTALLTAALTAAVLRYLPGVLAR